jgi:hypothetical protein
LGSTLDGCTSVCLGDREERARRARERDHGARRTRAEYMFDFYDDWDQEEGFDVGGSDGGWGGGSHETWDRLLAGTGAGRGDHVVDQPKRKRGMSYGTRGVRRKMSAPEEDPNVIPRTAPLGFLSKLPFKFGGTLRYKPSAANLRDHPGAMSRDDIRERGGLESEPLLGTDDGGDTQLGSLPQPRERSNTMESGDTSSSYRSRGDLFPSDEEGEEDAIPLDDEFAVVLERVEFDRGSNRTRSSQGKRRVDIGNNNKTPRTASRTTLSSTHSKDSPRGQSDSSSVQLLPSSTEDLRREEEEAARKENEELEMRRLAASKLAIQRGLNKRNDSFPHDVEEDVTEPKTEVLYGQVPGVPDEPDIESTVIREMKMPPLQEPCPGVDMRSEFVPARLPHFS